MNRITRIAVSAATGLCLTGGFSGIAGASSASIEKTGPNSTAREDFSNSLTFRSINDNDVSVRNNNPQTARSGNVSATNNTTAGDASSGMASNESSFTTSLSVSNPSDLMNSVMSHGDSGGWASITNTGPNSHTSISARNTVTATVNNTNDISVVNNNTQNATTGSAKVSGNTTGGDATSGDAVNTSNTDITVNVTN